MVAVAMVTVVNSVYADHGPGTSGGGASTQSAETMKAGKFAVEVREDFTEFESLSASQITTRVEQQTAREEGQRRRDVGCQSHDFRDQ